MSLLDQYNLSTNSAFLSRVQAAAVHAAIAIANEVANEVHTLTVTGNPTGGTFTLTYAGQISAPIAWNANAATVQAALQALTTIGNGNAVCAGGPLPGTGITITFAGTLGNLPVNLITHTDLLTGGVTPAAAIARTTAGVASVNHGARQALASKILANPVGYAQLMAIGVADNATVQADFPGPGYSLGVAEATAGNDIQFQVNSMFNAYT
jgi:hypothetical protein